MGLGVEFQDLVFAQLRLFRRRRQIHRAGEYFYAHFFVVKVGAKFAFAIGSQCRICNLYTVRIVVFGQEMNVA